MFIVSYLRHQLFMKLKVIINLFTDLSSRRSSVLLSETGVLILKTLRFAAGQRIIVCVVTPSRIDARHWRQRVVYSRMLSPWTPST